MEESDLPAAALMAAISGPASASCPCGCARGGLTDAISDINAMVIGIGPAMSTVHSMLAAAQAQSVSFQNMINTQQQNAMTQQAAAVEAVMRILSSNSGRGAS